MPDSSSSGLIPAPGIHRYASGRAVQGVYPETYTRSLTVPDKKRTFGDPSQKSYETENIGRALLVGCGPGRNETRSIEMHRGVIPLVEQVFKEILAAGLDYRITSMSGYMFRYVKDSVQGSWLHDPDYAGLAPDDMSNVTYARRDRELGRLHKPIDGEFQKGLPVERFDKLSNHAYGSAIDINPGTNQYSNDGMCDIHPLIVQIFQKHKFFWGGFYNTRRDYMHFEYSDTDLELADEIRKSFFFPIALGSSRNPALYYDNNESTTHQDLGPGVDETGPAKGAAVSTKTVRKGKTNSAKPAGGEATGKGALTTEGGFYPIALPSGGKSGLHGGTHLVSVRPGETVRAMAPGWIAAVRLSTAENPNSNATVQQSLRNWNNFVLVRHDVSPDASKDYVSFYSLYMHLCPFRVPLLGNGPTLKEISGSLAQIPWLRSLYLGRFGVLMRVSREGAPTDDTFPLGTCLWPAEPVQDAEGTPLKRTTVLSLDGSTVHQIPLRSLSDENGKFVRWWQWKPAPQKLPAVWDALLAGQVATFDRPFLPLQGNDVVGLTDTFSQHEFTPLPDDDGKGYKVFSRLMHWEAFGVSDKAALPMLVENLQKLGGSAQNAEFPEFKSTDPAALFSGTEIASKLPPDSAPAGAASLPEYVTPGKIVTMFDAGARLGAPLQVRFELRHLVKPSECHPTRAEHTFDLIPAQRQGETTKPMGDGFQLHISDTKAWITPKGRGQGGHPPPDVPLRRPLGPLLSQARSAAQDGRFPDRRAAGDRTPPDLAGHVAGSPGQPGIAASRAGLRALPGHHFAPMAQCPSDPSQRMAPRIEPGRPLRRGQGSDPGRISRLVGQEGGILRHGLQAPHRG